MADLVFTKNQYVNFGSVLERISNNFLNGLKYNFTIMYLCGVVFSVPTMDFYFSFQLVFFFFGDMISCM